MSIKRTTSMTSYSAMGAGGGSIGGLGRDSSFGRDHHHQTWSSAQGLHAGAGAGFGGSFGHGGGAGYGGGFSYGGDSGASRSSLTANGKLTMQDLNERLASYLDKVKTLEETNRTLEEKILEFHSAPSTVVEKSWKNFEDIIDPLKEKIKDLMTGIAQKTLELDNARLAADDFKSKYEMELSMRRTVENDINGLKELKRQEELNQSSLEHDVANLEEELADLKRTHEEELSEMRTQMAGTVNVELDSAPSVDLNRILANMRTDYELIIKRNQQQNEVWYQSQVEAHNAEVVQTTQEVNTSKSETRELQQKCQGLHAELEGLHSMKSSLELAVSATEARYQEHLHKIVVQAAQMEAELTHLRNESMQQTQDYKNLFNIKAKLEEEIAIYRQLLEAIDVGGKDAKNPSPAVKKEEGITDQDLVS